MFHKVLVALDQSQNSKKVFEAAITLAKATGCSLMLLHVLSIEEEVAPQMPTFTSMQYYPIGGKLFESYQEHWKTYEKQGLELLRSYTDKATSAGVKAEFTQNSGNPGRTICEIARTSESDLIVMGRRGYSGFNELLLGSVSNYVLHHAPCSVLTVQGAIDADSAVAQDQQVAVAL